MNSNSRIGVTSTTGGDVIIIIVSDDGEQSVNLPPAGARRVAVKLIEEAEIAEKSAMLAPKIKAEKGIQ